MSGSLKATLRKGLSEALEIFADDTVHDTNCRMGLARLDTLVDESGSAFVDARSKSRSLDILYGALARIEDHDVVGFLIESLQEMVDAIEGAPILEGGA